MIRVNRLFLIASICLVVFLLPPVLAIEPAWNYSEPNADIGGVAISSDGSSIAVAAGKVWLFSKDGKLLVKEPYGNLIAMTPNASAVATSYYSTIYFFKNNAGGNDTTPLKKIWETSVINNMESIDISDDGSTVALSTSGSGLLIYSATGTLLEYNKSHYSVVGVSANGKYVAGVSQYGLTSFSKSRGYVNKSYDLSLGSMPDFMALSSKGDFCVFNDDQRILRVRSSNGTEIWHTRATGDVMSLAMTPDGKSIIIGTDNGHIDKFDDKGNLTWSYNTNPKSKNYASVPGVAVSDNGANIAGGAAGGEVLLLNSRGDLQWSNQTNDHISHVAMSADGSITVAAGEHTVYAFTTQSRDPAKTTTVSRTNTPKITPVTPGIIDTVSDTFESSTIEIAAPTEAPVTIVTSPPQQYSVIITEQSPPSPVVGLAALALAVLVIRRRRY